MWNPLTADCYVQATNFTYAIIFFFFNQQFAPIHFYYCLHSYCAINLNFIEGLQWR
jgi:hypothetical protein